MKDFDDQLLDILLVLDSSLDTISTLRGIYEEYCYSDVEDNQERGYDFIQRALKEKEQDAILNRKKIETLHNKVKGTINLVNDSLRQHFISDADHCIPSSRVS